MSLISPSSARLATWTPAASRCCSGVSTVRSSRSLRPITPLSGVRISWLIVARNSDFCREAAIASSRAWATSCLRALALGDPRQLLGHLLGHRLDQLEAPQRRSRGDGHDGVHLVVVQDRERDREPALVPHRDARGVRALGQLQLRGRERVAAVGLAVLVGGVERLDPPLPAGPARTRAPAPSRRAAAPASGPAGAPRPGRLASLAALATACMRLFCATWSSSASSLARSEAISARRSV